MMYRIVRTDEFDGDAELLRAYFCAEDLIRIQKSSRSLCGYCLAVQMIREKIGNDFEIFFEKNGRPYISGEKIHFSISHSKDFAACAVSDSRCGIDIEQPRKVSRRLIERMMSDGEIRFIEDSADGASAFLRLWTMKEAWLKSVEFRSIFDAASLDFVKNGKIIGQMDGKTCLTVDNGEYVMSLWT